MGKLQIKSKGQVSYSTGLPASLKTIHPSKLRKTMEATVSTLTISKPPDCSESNTDSSDNSKDSPWKDENAESTSTRKHNRTGIARRLVTSSNLSSRGSKGLQDVLEEFNPWGSTGHNKREYRQKDRRCCSAEENVQRERLPQTQVH
ncbi:unnamed protein product [Brassicogethes aeneus]|uniref:Uncharacterized protein n=1 Tax=Brassicogethes aeneus TaxID=1431903 RepID=A0A9P0B9W8_BRAAE|nr:unnamed protein product [Brassicogethes aeneus]